MAKNGKGREPARNPPGEKRRKSPGKSSAAGNSSQSSPGVASRPPISAPPSTPIACVGASAGGLDSFRKFIAAVPRDSHISYVLIQHLDPTQTSLTAELLRKHTSMPVVQVTGPTPAEADHVYVIPPNKFMSVEKGVLHLSDPPTPRGLRMPIDFFLRSLAKDRAEAAIGVILSGTGSDGTLGIKEIRAAGGITVVQTPESAQYDGMPRSAIATRCVDHVLPPDQIPAVLSKYVVHSYLKLPQEAEDRKPAAERLPDDLTSILSVLRARTKFDFNCYKKGTLGRRVFRRMGLRHIEVMADYLNLLRQDPGEVTALQKDLLISVTSFFRDPDGWKLLENDVIPRLVDRAADDQFIRAWVAGCASGEEAYGLAMLFVEAINRRGKNCRIQVFASDADAEALEVARAGVYPENIAADVSEERLRRFFTHSDRGFTVKKEIRDLVVFAKQNLIGDPPFSRLDLVSCRNVMIYLLPEVQKKIIALLHFSITEGGYLFLGSSESIGPQDDLFEIVSKRWRIYRRIGPKRAGRVQYPFVHKEPPPPVPAPASLPAAARVAVFAQRLLMDRYVPASVVIDRKYRILHFSGPTHDYLIQPSGEPTVDLISMAREGLQSKLRVAIHQAVRENRAVTVANARVRRGRGFQSVKVVIEPLPAERGMDGLLMLVFSDQAPPAGKSPRTAPAAAHSNDESIIRQLEGELKATRDDLQSAIDELETSNEELKASNEESMSVNEEFQSTNEELETSKEELQSLNEELSTVNNQLQVKIEELEAANNDLNNLLTSTDIATVFLDTNLLIKRFTPATGKLLHMIPSDVGRPFGDIKSRFADHDLAREAEHVLQNLAVSEKEVETQEGDYYIRRILPYRTHDHHIEGVVITFLDITARRTMERQLEALNQSLEARVRERTESLAKMTEAISLASSAVRLGVWDWDVPASTITFGRNYHELYGLSAPLPRTDFQKWLDLVHPDDRARVKEEMQAALAGIRAVDIEFRAIWPDGSTHWILRRSDLVSAAGAAGRERVVGICVDVTERKNLEAELVRISEQERIRLGSELHDSLGQQIGGIRLIASSLCQSLAESHSPHSAAALQLVQEAGAAVQQVRRLASGLMPVEVDSAGLMKSLENFCRSAGELNKLNCRFNCRLPVLVVDNFTATHLYRIVGEAVQNAIRHAKAKDIEVSLSEDKQGLLLKIEDDGAGFTDPPPSGPAQLGMQIMRYRAGLIGAILTIQSAPKRGTVVACRLPRKDMRHDTTPGPGSDR